MSWVGQGRQIEMGGLQGIFLYVKYDLKEGYR
jgi:hypothetical protein